MFCSAYAGPGLKPDPLDRGSVKGRLGRQFDYYGDRALRASPRLLMTTPRFDFRHDGPECLAVLMVNLGTPASPRRADVRRYLKEFLWDPRVVEIPRPLWWLILNAVILNTRPGRSAAAYAKIWTDEGSPLMVYSKRQQQALQQRVVTKTCCNV